MNNKSPGSLSVNKGVGNNNVRNPANDNNNGNNNNNGSNNPTHVNNTHNGYVKIPSGNSHNANKAVQKAATALTVDTQNKNAPALQAEQNASRKQINAQKAENNAKRSKNQENKSRKNAEATRLRAEANAASVQASTKRNEAIEASIAEENANALVARRKLSKELQGTSITTLQPLQGSTAPISKKLAPPPGNVARNAARNAAASAKPAVSKPTVNNGSPNSRRQWINYYRKIGKKNNESPLSTLLQEEKANAKSTENARKANLNAFNAFGEPSKAPPLPPRAAAPAASPAQAQNNNFGEFQAAPAANAGAKTLEAITNSSVQGALTATAAQGEEAAKAVEEVKEQTQALQQNPESLEAARKLSLSLKTASQAATSLENRSLLDRVVNSIRPYWPQLSKGGARKRRSHTRSRRNRSSKKN